MIKGYVIDKSPIHGKGVFSTRNFEPGDFIGVAIVKGTSTPQFGKWLNHKDDANSVIDLTDDGEYKVYAGSKISLGDEITVDYTMEPTLKQPQDKWKFYKPNRRGQVQERLATLFESLYLIEYKYITEVTAPSTLSNILKRARKISDGTYAKLRTKCSQFSHIGGITTKKKSLRYNICQEKAQLNSLVKLKTILEGSVGACKGDSSCRKGLGMYVKRLDANVKMKRARIKSLEMEYQRG